MTDIYLHGHAPRRSRGCLFLGMIALALAIGMLFLVRGCRNRQRDRPAAGETPAESPRTRAKPAVDPGFQSAFAEANRLFDAGQPTAAREAAQALLAQTRDEASVVRVEELLTLIHKQMVFDPLPMAEKTDHIITRGETLGALAERNGTTVQLIMRSNQLRGNVIRVGDRLRIFRGTLRVWVDKSDNVMKVYLNDEFFLRYRVGTGQHSRTPAGHYQITLRQKHPTWYRPDGKEIPYGDPENLLGTHYLKLNTPGIGLHGTWEPDTIGSQSSAGCVRLLNEHIEELHDLLPVGTEVVIVE